jgi:hypothetical protein
MVPFQPLQKNTRRPSQKTPRTVAENTGEMLQKTPSLQKNSGNRCKKTGTGWKNTIVWKYTDWLQSQLQKKTISMNITSSSMIHDPNQPGD